MFREFSPEGGRGGGLDIRSELIFRLGKRTIFCCLPLKSRLLFIKLKKFVIMASSGIDINTIAPSPLYAPVKQSIIYSRKNIQRQIRNIVQLRIFLIINKFHNLLVRITVNCFPFFNSLSFFI